MKFDPFTWNEIPTNEEIPHGKGKVQLRLSQACPVYISAQGVEALAGVGTEITAQVSEAVMIRVQAPKGVRVFMHQALPTSLSVAESEIFTNADRMPYESGAVAEVTRARRMFEIERREMLRSMRGEFARQKAAIRKAQAAAAVADSPAQPADETPAEDNQPEGDAE